MDYLTPQIYWNIGYEPADYAVLANWWQEVAKGTKVKLYPGLALYKLGDAAQSDAWLDREEILRQIELNRSLGINGECFYGYSKIKEDYLGIRERLGAYYAN